MNLPNKLTLTRIVLTPFFVAAILLDFPCHYLAALVIFSFASITDMLDGRIARSRDMVTDFGKFCDPLADKILVLSALLCFVEKGLCSCIIVIIVLFREFAVSSVRLMAAKKGKVVAANIWGKIKTVTQIVAVILIFVLQFALELINMNVIGLSSAQTQAIGSVFYIIGSASLWISTLFCIISGIIYLRDNKEFIGVK